MQTAALAVTSSASRTSSGVNESGRRNRVSTATPRVWPRAWIGTDIVEWMPYSLTRSARTGSQASHSTRSRVSVDATMVWPASRESAWGEGVG